MAAFSNPTSHGVISESDQVSPEQLLKRGKVSQRKKKSQRSKQKRVKTKPREPSPVKVSEATHTPPIITSAQLMSPEQVEANLASLDRKLENEHARRMELESMLRMTTQEFPTEDPKSLGQSLTTRLSARQNQTKKTRVSSPGTLLRRGSQVGKSERTSPAVTTVYNRQYRHARELESEMIRTEEELAITKSELARVTGALMEVQNELNLRTTELEQSRGKVDSLLRMVKHVLQHLAEKRESRRFSMRASKEIQRQIAEPLSKLFGEEDTKMSDYIDERISAISAILPQWSAVYGNNYNASDPGLYEDVVDDEEGVNDSEYSSTIDPNEEPPPVPADASVSRRNKNTLPPVNPSTIPLPAPPPGIPLSAGGSPDQDIIDALLEIWDRIDDEEDGILSLREIHDKLMLVVPDVSVDVRDNILEILKANAFMLHGDGNAAFEVGDFVEALVKSECGKHLAKLIKMH
jgi:hypothetical protein